jgi:PHD/YefM family antitoxin component YafN of YafNO toxin-antitoxin module
LAKSDSLMVHRLPLTEARHHLGEVVKRIHLNKEYIILEKDGIPVVGIMDADELEDYLELRDPKVREHIRKSYEEYKAGKSRPAEELLAELTTKRRAKPQSSRRKHA